MKIRHLFCLPILLFLIQLPCAGQYKKYTVEGRVADSLSRSGLEHATITIKKQDETVLETASGKYGAFSVSLQPGEYHLIITHTGYNKLEKTFTAEKNNIQLPVFFLQTAITALKPVTVEAKKPFITLSAGKITLNVAESAVMAGNSAWDLLRLAPGVITGESGSLSLNGKAVTVYIDGRLSYLSGEQLKNLLTTMQTSSIDKIELISNPSARYDAAGAAVINIKTIKINKKGFNGSYTAGIGASRFLKYNSGIDLNYFKNKVNCYGSYDFSHNKNNYRPYSERSSRSVGATYYINESGDEIRDRYNHNYKAGIDYAPGKNTTIGLLLRVFSNQRDREVSNLTTIGAKKNIPDSVIGTRTSGTALFSSPALNLFLKTSFDSSKKELVINADYYRYQQQWEDDFYTDFTDKNQNPYRPSQLRRDHSPTLLDIYAVAADYTQQSKNSVFSAGIKTSYIKTDNDVRWENNAGTGWMNDTLRTNYFIYKEAIPAAYAGINTHFKKFTIEAMLRAEHTTTTGESITLDSTFKRRYLDWFPSVSLVSKLNKKNEFTASYRKSIQRPYYRYVNPFLIYQGEYNYFQGNPDLKPGYSHAIELIHACNEILFTTLSYTYTKNFTGIFYKQDDATKIITEYYDNYENSQSWSLNITFSKNLRPWWLNSTYGSLSRSVTAYRGLHPGKSSPEFVAGTFNSFTLKKAGLKIEVSGSFTAANTDGFYDYKSYGAFNIGLQKELLKKKGNLRLNLRDIFKTNFFTYKAHYSNINIYTTSPFDSRTVQLNFTYRFGKQFANKNKNRKSSIESETNRIN